MADPITPPATPDPAAPPAANPKAVTPPVGADGKPAVEPPKGDAKPDAKPEAGDIVLKLPDGAKIDEKVLGEFKGIGKELGLKSDGAQKLFDFYAKAEAAKAAAEQAAQDKQQDEWEEQLMAMPGIEEKLGLAKKATKGLANENAQAFFDSPYVGSNPDIVEFLSKVGKLMSEAPVIEGEGSVPKAFTWDDAFPSMKKLRK